MKGFTVYRAVGPAIAEPVGSLSKNKADLTSPSGPS